MKTQTIFNQPSEFQAGPLLVSAKEAAKMLGVCTKTLWNNTQPHGPIPCVRVGGRVTYAVHHLHEFIDSQATAGAAN
jgi:hypothetical protein